MHLKIFPQFRDTFKKIWWGIKFWTPSPSWPACLWQNNRLNNLPHTCIYQWKLDLKNYKANTSSCHLTCIGQIKCELSAITHIQCLNFCFGLWILHEEFGLWIHTRSEENWKDLSEFLKTFHFSEIVLSIWNVIDQFPCQNFQKTQLHYDKPFHHQTFLEYFPCVRPFLAIFQFVLS